MVSELCNLSHTLVDLHLKSSLLMLLMDTITNQFISRSLSVSVAGIAFLPKWTALPHRQHMYIMYIRSPALGKSGQPSTAAHLTPFMMTSSNGNIFRVTGPLCGEFTGPGEFPAQRPVTRSFDVFFHLRLNKRLSKQPWGWWFETPGLSLWRHRNVDIHPPAREWHIH